MVGTPVFQHKIPYGEWYIIVTSCGSHFYFNKPVRKSYWQLFDVFQDNPHIDRDEFLSSINFEEVAILMSKVNGLKGIDGYFFKAKEGQPDVPEEEKSTTGELNQDENEGVDKAANETDDLDIEEAQNYDTDTRDKFIRDLLQEEGYIQEDEEEEKIPNPKPGNSGLNLGYSSDEDSSEEEENSEAHETIQHTQTDTKDGDEEEGDESQQDEDDGHLEHDGQNNLGLDLSLSASEDETVDKSEFFELLDAFKGRISIYDPWFLVEEELLSEFIKHPSYYSINDAAEREKLFTEWCKQQQDEDQDDKSTGEAHEGLDEVYSTPSQAFFVFLQTYKKDVKKLFYLEFNSKFASEIENSFSELSSKERETLYRQYKIMITDYAEFEKRAKKCKDNDVNLKKVKIDQFLSNARRNISVNNIPKETLLQINQSEDDAFQKWTKICNLYSIPISIGNCVENFIVGDEKRLQSYTEMLISLYD